MIYTFSRRALRFICWLYIISGCVLLVSYLLPALYLPLIFLENGYLHLLLVFSDIVILKLIHLFFGYGNSTIIFIHTLGLGFLSLGILGIKSLMWIENHQKKGELVWFGLVSLAIFFAVADNIYSIYLPENASLLFNALSIFWSLSYLILFSMVSRGSYTLSSDTIN